MYLGNISFLIFGIKDEVVLEVGSKISMKDFYKLGFVYNKPKFVSNIKKIDTDKVDDYVIKIKTSKKNYNVSLKMVDTTAPKVVFKDFVAGINYAVNPADFIESMEDYSDITVSILNDVSTSVLGKHNIKLKVSDSFSNSVIDTRVLNITILKENYELEKGDILKKEDILFDTNFKSYIKDEEIDLINKGDVGKYKISFKVDDNEYTCNINKKDTNSPELSVKNVIAYINDELTINSFIQKVSDYSDYTISMIGNLDTSKERDSTVSITATDVYSNSVTKEVALKVKKDNDPPGINGLGNVTVNKYAKVDYYSGVSCYDAHDGSLAVKLVSGINTSQYGTQYATYSCTDKSGNVKTSKRQYYVNHDSTDTHNKLVSYAQKAGKDPRSILYYVRGLVKYSSNWGGNDPVWFGLTNYQGNCYVHALIYQQMLDYYGYNSRLIWVTDKSHYWVLVNMEGGWKHCDPTPTARHEKVTCVNDAVRYANLQGRNWDRSNWPEAN